MLAQSQQQLLEQNQSPVICCLVDGCFVLLWLPLPCCSLILLLPRRQHRRQPCTNPTCLCLIVHCAVNAGPMPIQEAFINSDNEQSRRTMGWPFPFSLSPPAQKQQPFYTSSTPLNLIYSRNSPAFVVALAFYKQQPSDTTIIT